MKELILEAQALIPFLKTADMATRNGLEKLCKTTAETISELVATNEALTAERDEHWKSFVHWRKEADGLTEQLEAARADAKEAEAYAEELERDLNICRMAQVVMDNTVAELERERDRWREIANNEAVEGEANRNAGLALEAKLAKSVEALREWDDLIKHQYSGSREAMSDMTYAAQHTAALLAEIEGEKV